MKLVALTGGIGSGKTTVSELFRNKGVPVIDTDVIAREIVQKNGTAYPLVVNEFGKEILDKEKEINRSRLRQLIFTDPGKKHKLESILHPIIWEQVKLQLENVSAKYAIVVVPLLFETTPGIQFDRVLVIDTPIENQLNRVMKRDQISRQEAEKIIESQVSREARCKQADDIILNEDITLLDKAVEKLHLEYLKLSSIN